MIFCLLPEGTNAWAMGRDFSFTKLCQSLIALFMSKQGAVGGLQPGASTKWSVPFPTLFPYFRVLLPRQCVA